MQASAAKQARTMSASQDPPWHGMKGMTRITSEFKVLLLLAVFLAAATKETMHSVACVLPFLPEDSCEQSTVQ